MINIYVPNIGAPKYIKQIFTDTKVEIASNAITVRLPHSTLNNGRTIQTENHYENTELELCFRSNGPDRYRTFQPTAREYIFFSSTHTTFSRINHIRWVTDWTRGEFPEWKKYKTEGSGVTPSTCRMDETQKKPRDTKNMDGSPWRFEFATPVWKEGTVCSPDG